MANHLGEPKTGDDNLLKFPDRLHAHFLLFLPALAVYQFALRMIRSVMVLFAIHSSLDKIFAVSVGLVGLSFGDEWYVWTVLLLLLYVYLKFY